MLSALLDLRLVRNFAGDWSFGFFSSWLGSSEAAPPLTLTPMLWLAVLTVAEALDRQLPPLNHLLLGLWLSFCSFRAEPFVESSDSFVVASTTPFWRIELPSGVLEAGVVACVLALQLAGGSAAVGGS